MKSTFYVQIYIAVLLLFTSSYGICKETSQKQKKYTVELTTEQVKKCIKLLTDFVKLGTLPKDPSKIQQHIKKLESLAKESGFSSYNEYIISR